VDVLLVSLGGDTAEVEALIDSCGHRRIETFVQRRDRPDPRSFVGRGKLKELEEWVDRVAADAVVFNGELRPSQHYHLEQTLGVECYDRLRLILEIFGQRAHSKEAKLQVEYALLQYEVPLLREWIHEGAVGERPGFMAGGGYRVDAYYETVKRRMRKIKDELERARREREVRRSRRKAGGYHLVALAGYANAGKSSLLNVLTGEKVLVDDRMFSTLQTTTRRLAGPRKRILVTDTVGFVDDVPYWLVEAFNATLEEIYQADLVLLLLDATDSDSQVLRKARLAARILLPRIGRAVVVPVLTKVDLLAGTAAAAKGNLLEETEFHEPPLAVSATTGEGLAGLRQAILRQFEYPVELEIVLGADGESAVTLGWLYDACEVVRVDYRNGETHVRLGCRSADLDRVRAAGRVVSVREVR